MKIQVGGGQGLRDNTSFIIALLFLALYYLVYRYPLQINNALTSPTYSDTPFILQAGKYMIFLAVIAGALLVRLAAKDIAVSRTALAKTLSYGYFTAQALIAFLFTGNPWLLQTGVFFPAVLLAACSRDNSLDIRKVCGFLGLFVYFALAVEALQLALFFGLGRLPALAYINSLSVRFGSVWDDPNGFAIMICMLMPLVMASGGRSAVSKGLLGTGLLTMLLLTQSLTGVAVFFLSLIIGTLGLVALRLTRPWMLTIAAALATVSAILAVYFYSPFAQQLVALKAQSISEHIGSLDVLQDSNLMNFFGFNPSGRAGESGLINMLVNFGVLFSAVYLAVGVRTVWRLAGKIHRHGGEDGGELYYGAFFFVIAFYLGLLNLPLDTIFPLNLLLAVAIIISECDHSPTRGGADEREVAA